MNNSISYAADGMVSSGLSAPGYEYIKLGNLLCCFDQQNTIVLISNFFYGGHVSSKFVIILKLFDRDQMIVGLNWIETLRYKPNYVTFQINCGCFDTKEPIICCFQFICYIPFVNHRIFMIS